MEQVAKRFVQKLHFLNFCMKIVMPFEKSVL